MADFYYKINSAENLEEFIENEIYPFCGLYEPDTEGAMTKSYFNRWRLPDDRTWLEFKRGAEAKSLRQLWEVSRETARRDLKALTEKRDEVADQKPPTMQMARQIEEKAIELGLTALTERERPGPQAYTRIANNHLAGAIPRHLVWEKFINGEEERKATLLGHREESGEQTIIPKSNTVKNNEEGVELRKPAVTTREALQDVLRTRSIGYALLDIVPLQTYEDLKEAYMDALREVTTTGMRRPYISEVKFFDREIHELIYRRMLRDPASTLAEGIDWYLQHKDDPMWNIIKPQDASLPDQSSDKSASAPGKRKYVEIDIEGSEPTLSEVVDPTAAAQGGGQGAKALCYICKKPRSEHKSGRFCRQTPEQLAESRAAQVIAPPQTDESAAGSQSSGRGIKKEKTWTDKQPKATPLPAYMVGKAGRTPPSPGQPNGLSICWAFHHPDGDQCSLGNRCLKAHACCNFLPQGICNEPHRMQDCHNV